VLPKNYVGNISGFIDTIISGAILAIQPSIIVLSQHGWTERELNPQPLPRQGASPHTAPDSNNIAEIIPEYNPGNACAACRRGKVFESAPKSDVSGRTAAERSCPHDLIAV